MECEVVNAYNFFFLFKIHSKGLFSFHLLNLEVEPAANA
jgi:hypothetical protein